MKSSEQILSEFNASINSMTDQKGQVREIIEFIMIYGDSYGDKILPVIQKGISISKSIGFEAGEAYCRYNRLFFEGATQGNANSIYGTSFEELLALLEKLKSEEDLYALGHNLFAFFHWFKGEYEKAFNVIFEAIKLYENKNDTGLAWNLFALSVFYFDTKDYDNSVKYYEKALEIFTLNNYVYGMARSSNGLASNAIVQNRHEEAIEYLNFSTNIYRDLGHYSGLSRTLNDMGLLEKTKNNYTTAIPFFEESIALRKDIDHIQGLITTYTELGETHLLMKNHSLAFEQLNKGLDLSLIAKSPQKQMRIYKLLYDTYKDLGNTELALKNFEQFFEVKSKLLSDESANNIKKLQTKHEKEKSEKEAEIERLKNIELKKANKIIQQKNKDITDSINYARRIQKSLMPTEKYIERILSEIKTHQPE